MTIITNVRDHVPTKRSFRKRDAFIVSSLRKRTTQRGEITLQTITYSLINDICDNVSLMCVHVRIMPGKGPLK